MAMDLIHRAPFAVFSAKIASHSSGLKPAAQPRSVKSSGRLMSFEIHCCLLAWTARSVASAQSSTSRRVSGTSHLSQLKETYPVAPLDEEMPVEDYERAVRNNGLDNTATRDAKVLELANKTKHALLLVAQVARSCNHPHDDDVAWQESQLMQFGVSFKPA